MLNYRANRVTNHDFCFVIADPLKDPHICGRPQCDTESGKFSYAQNIRYVYDYTSHVHTEFKGTGQDSSNIYVTGTVKIAFPTKCEGVLKLEDIELREWPLEAARMSANGFEYKLHEHSKSFAYDVQKHDLRYATNAADEI